jgi:hypothetical protein
LAGSFVDCNTKEISTIPRRSWLWQKRKMAGSQEQEQKIQNTKSKRVEFVDNQCTLAARCTASVMVLLMLCGQGASVIILSDAHINPLLEFTANAILDEP